MVQVDIIWSYAFGASFAAAAARQLGKQESPFVSKYFMFTLLFLSLLFVPSGVYLLWEHTQWETMQVAISKDDIPSWLTTLFVLTNVTQGIVGYFISYKFARAKNYFAAHVNWIIAWIIFWFILVCGWDCTGYQRFLYDMSVNNGELWAPGKHMGLSFFYSSNVWWSLVLMALFFAPMLIYGYVQFIREGMENDPSIPQEAIPSPIKIQIIVFGIQWVVSLACAILVSILVMQLYTLTVSYIAAYIIGIFSFSIVAYFLLFKREKILHKLLKTLYGND